MNARMRGLLILISESAAATQALVGKTANSSGCRHSKHSIDARTNALEIMIVEDVEDGFVKAGFQETIKAADGENRTGHCAGSFDDKLVKEGDQEDS